jgi:predicted transcriptional regulator of viral defense system
MAGKTRFAIAEKAIRAFFLNNEQKVFSYAELDQIHSKRRFEWSLTISSTTDRFIEQLIRRDILSYVELNFEGSYGKKELYATPEATIFQIASAVRNNGYLTHYTAMLLHGLTFQVPNTVYVTFEHSKPQIKKPKPHLEQKNIDAAFRQPQKTTGSFVVYNSYKILVLNGQFTNQLGVYSQEGYRLTNLERTLIDIVVRPAYSGGVSEVLNAYKEAKTRISINKLIATLKRLDFIYPYHQSIGFYLEKAGYSIEQVQPFKALPMMNDFYLTYDMNDMNYSSDWRVYYPAGM